MIAIAEAEYVNPINAPAGLYVSVEARGLVASAEIRSDEASEMAAAEAARQGYDPDGRGSVGFPVTKGPRYYTRAFWFYQRAGGR